MHSDLCKEFIRANTSFNLAVEFIGSLDPERDDATWQRFQTPSDILPELQAWLGGDATAPAPPSGPVPSAPEIKGIRLARQLPENREDAALQRIRVWLAEPATEEKLRGMSPADAAALAIERFREELARRA